MDFAMTIRSRRLSVSSPSLATPASATATPITRSASVRVVIGGGHPFRKISDALQGDR
jgi:hypothetical protein